MNYPFIRHTLDWLLVHESQVSPGMLHLKSFVQPTRPADQVTLNLYVRGAFRLSWGGPSTILRGGQSSLDLPVETLPAGQLVVEEALSDGVRLCLQPADPKTKWVRRRVDLKAGEHVVAVDGFVLPLDRVDLGRRDFCAEVPTSVFVVERVKEAT